MLPLDDSRWGELTSAYGSGLEVPGLLRRLASEGVPAVPKSYWDGCPWTMLWATICHQGTVCTASYAAVPHLVRLASQAAPDTRVRLIDLITYIEMGRAWRSAPPVPAFLEAGYVAALEELRGILAGSMRERWEPRSACRLAAAFAHPACAATFASTAKCCRFISLCRVGSGPGFPGAEKWKPTRNRQQC